MIYFTADEHYGHENIIKYCNRPFKNADEMDRELIKNHNEIVGDSDTVYHLGDFTLAPKNIAYQYLDKLNGNHIMIRGSHDMWMDSGYKEIIYLRIDGQLIVLCHYAMRTWQASHYNSWQLYGHSHGTLEGIGKQFDVGVDVHGFKPISLDLVKEIMKSQPDNVNLIKNTKN